jgi:hypothetical protein
MRERMHSCDTNVFSLKPSKYVELAPGVFVLRPGAGLVNLGVPMGIDAYVTATVEESVRKHERGLHHASRRTTTSNGTMAFPHVQLSRSTHLLRPTIATLHPVATPT